MVFANDSDAGPNANVEYFLQNPTGEISSTFSINRTTGEVTLIGPLDRETTNLYFIPIMAVDNGILGSLEGVGELGVVILDINDEAPLFTQDPYVPNVIPEDVDIGYVVITVHADDSDLGENGTVSYMLVDSSYEFAINDTTGDIYTVAGLDFERQTQYILTVVATDGGAMSLSGNSTVVINIVPINDNVPMCNPEDRLAILREDAFLNSMFFFVNASDGDEGDVLTFSINSSSSVFDVVKLTETTAAVITLTADFDRFITPEYDIVIRVSDTANQECFIRVSIVVGEPSRFDFNLEGAGYFVGPVVPILGQNGYSQDIAFFRNSSLSGSVTGRLGDISEDAFYTRDPLAVSRINGILREDEVWFDQPIISVVAQVRDSSFRTVTQNSNLTLLITPGGGSGGEDDIVETTTGCERSGEPDSGICIIDISVPESWFGVNNSVDVVLMTEGGGVSTELGNVLLRMPQTSSITTETIIIELPHYDLYSGSEFTFWVGALPELDVTTFSLRIGFSGINISLDSIIMNDKWFCNVNDVYLYHCYRTSMGTSQISPSIGIDRFFGVRGLIQTGTVGNSVVDAEIISLTASSGYAITYPTPVTLFDRQGLTSMNSIMNYVQPELRGIFAKTPNPELVNTLPVTIPITTYGIYSPMESGFVEVDPESLSCSSELNITSQIGSSCEFFLNAVLQECDSMYSINIVHSSGGVSFDLPIKVWCLSETSIQVGDPILNAVSSWLDGTCASNVYQQSGVSIFGRLQSGSDTSPLLDITDDWIDSLTSDDTSVVQVDTLTHSISGVSPGETTLTLVIGTMTSNASVSVSDDEVYVYDMYSEIVSSLEVYVTPDTYTSVSSLRVSAEIIELFYANAETSGSVTAYVYFTDGARYDIPWSELSLNTSDSNVASSDTTTIMAQSEGMAELEITWIPRTCPAQLVLGMTTTQIQVLTPSPIRLTVGVTDGVIAGDTRGVRIPGLSSTTTLIITLDYDNGTSVNVSASTLGITIDTPPSLVLTDLTLQAVSNAMSAEITVRYASPDNNIFTERVTIDIVNIVNLRAIVQDYPDSVITDPSNEILLNLIAGTEYYQQAQIMATVQLTNGSSIPVSATYTPLTQLSVNIDNDGIVTPLSAGSGVVQVSVGEFSPVTVSISIQDIEQHVEEIRNLRLVDVTATLKQITADAIFADDTAINDVISFDQGKLSSLIEFSINLEGLASVNATTWVLTITDNHYDLVTLTASSSNPPRFSSLQFAANLETVLGGVDFGLQNGVPQPPVDPGENFTVDVRINIGDQNIGAIDMLLFYDSTVLDVISVEVPLSGVSGVRTKAPLGEIQLTYVGLGPDLEYEPCVLRVTYNTLTLATPRVTTINSSLEILRNESLDLIGRATSDTYSLDILVGDEPSSPRSRRSADNSNHLREKRQGPDVTLGDVNGDGIFNIIDAAYVVRYLAGIISTVPTPSATDGNGDGITSVADVIFLTRVSAGLVPFLPSVAFEPVSNTNDCMLDLQAVVTFDSNGPDFTRTSVYFILSYPQGSDLIGYSVDNTSGSSMDGRILDDTSVLYQAYPVDADSNLYESSLLTPIDSQFNGIGLTVMIVTSNDENRSSRDRVAIFQKSSLFINGSQLIPQLRDFPQPLNLPNGIIIGAYDGFSPFSVFNNSVRSDYCRFDGTNITLLLEEDFSIGGTVYSIVTFNFGFPSTGEVYTISGTDVFNVTLSGEVQLAQMLDYETILGYSFDVSVFSTLGGYDAGSIRIDVVVLDVNDNPPEFLDIETFSVSLLEDVSVGQFVFDVNGRDRDSGANGVFVFSIDERTDAYDQFMIDQQSGIILVMDTLDRENTSEYFLLILATDMGNPPLTGQATLNISVGDINDNSPMFIPDNEYTVIIMEGVFNAELIPDFQIVALDRDEGLNGMVELTLQSLNQTSPVSFVLLPDGTLEITGEIDREVVDYYDFIITATDGGETPLSNIATLRVVVGDVNDNAPVFDPDSEIMFLVEEDKVVGTSIYQFSATDDDRRNNSIIAYSIEESFSGPFAIDRTSGVLRVSESINVGQEYSLVIVAQDSDPTQPRSVSLLITIKIIEGQVIRFDVGEEGFLLDTRTRVSNRKYTQRVGSLFRQDINTRVLASGGINNAVSNELDQIELPNLGDIPISTSLRGSLLQEIVSYSFKAVTIFVQAYDIRETISRPTTIRIHVIASDRLRLQGGPSFVDDTCVTSADLGVCVIQIRLPDEWFARPSTDDISDKVTVWANVASENTLGINLGELIVENSPAYAINFDENRIVIIQPSHTIYPGQNVTMEVYIASPLDLVYTSIDAEVTTGGPVVDINFDRNIWDCRLSVTRRLTCDRLALPDDRPLKLVDFIITPPDTATTETVELNNIIIGSLRLFFTIRGEYTISPEQPQYYFVVARQPDIVNTAYLNNVPVNHLLSYFTLNNSVSVLEISGQPIISEVQFPNTLGIRCTIPDPEVIQISDNCSEVSVYESSMVDSSGVVDVTVVSSLTSAVSGVNTVRLNIWSPGPVNLSASTTTLYSILGWKDPRVCSGSDQYQTSRLSAMATFTSGTNTFTADVYPLIASRIEASMGVEIVDRQRGIIQGVTASPDQPGIIRYDGKTSEILRFNVTEDFVNRMRIDPILASLRLSLTQDQVDSRLDPTEVSLEILSSLFFFQERTEVTMSVVLENGRRIVISDPLEIRLQSSNTSILSVDNNYVIAEGVGVAELIVSWINCDVILSSNTIEISVEFNEHRPTFANNTQTAGIIENAPLGTTITIVFADDLDFASTDLTRRDTEYRFMDAVSSYGGVFVLDKFTGVLLLNGPLDRETRDNYLVQIEVTDRAQRQAEQQIDSGVGNDVGSGSGIGFGNILIPPLSPRDVINVNIQVTDFNDNSPVCVGLSRLVLDRSVEVATLVTTLVVTDADIGSNGEIIFEDIRGDYAPQFLTVDSQTGVVITISDLSTFTEATTLQPLISVRDNGVSPNDATCELSIKLYNFKDTVGTFILGDVQEFESNIFERIIGDILMYEINIVYVNTINSTNYEAGFFGRDSNGNTIPSNELANAISSFSDRQYDLLIQAGINVIFVMSNDDVPTILPPVVTRPFPAWAVVVIVILNSVIIIAVLLIILGIALRRYKRMREVENQRNLNKKTGLRNIDDLDMGSVDAERIELGGIVDPERGALVYRKTTQVETVEPEHGSEFTQKKIKKVTSETTWLGQGKGSDKEALIKATEDEVEVTPWHDEELESNPLYSSAAYESNFQNPLYTNRQSVASSEDPVISSGGTIETSDVAPFFPGGSSGPGLDDVDTLF